MEERARAPRIQAYICLTQGRSVIVIPRSDWDTLGVNGVNPVEIDITHTPLVHVVQKATVLAVVAQQLSSSNARVSVYRYDEADQPTPVNVDHYSVWVDLAGHPRIYEMIRAASTSYDANLVRYLRENVFWVMEQPGDDHWLPELPASVQAVINIRTTST